MNNEDTANEIEVETGTSCGSIRVRRLSSPRVLISLIQPSGRTDPSGVPIEDMVIIWADHLDELIAALQTITE